jgi:TRAP-type mannitol/chloroaromatic compound transport system permease large subunit
MPSYKASLINDPLGRVISLNDIDVGAMPFAIAALVVIALLVAFPGLAMVLIK